LVLEGERIPDFLGRLLGDINDLHLTIAKLINSTPHYTEVGDKEASAAARRAFMAAF
jgi:hypothetical protein